MISRQEAQARARELVSQMTLEEKATQLRFNSPAIERLGVPAYNWWNEALHGVARCGTATMFPQAIGMAAAFDEKAMEQVGDVIATEGRAKYNAHSALGDRDLYKGLTFWSPNVNIFRDPRWGRGHETYGEDPYLTSRLGVGYIKGVQGDGKSGYLKAAACAKHFAVHSGPEANRHEFDAITNQKDLWETYLPAFEAAVKEADVEAIMGAYNRVNGEPCCGSKTLLKDILRGKWAYQGHVVSDCWAICNFHQTHKVTSTPAESAALALENGCDVNCGSTYLNMLQAYQDGLVTEEQITVSCERAFTTRFLLGLFDEDCEYNAIPYTANDTDEHDALAREMAEKSMVLLKNNGVLPLDPHKVKTVAVVGPNANSIGAMRGNYYGTSSRMTTLLAGIRAYCAQHGIRVLYSEGCGLLNPTVEFMCAANDRLSEAIQCANHADVVIACVGLDETLEGEQGDQSNYSASGDKTTLMLPECQQTLLNAMEATGKPLVTVLAVGSALNVPQGDAQLVAWYSGQAGGTALARILFGEVNPSGKLPVTFYHNAEDLPDFEDYSMKNRTYRYFTGDVLYPFGHGLSYTTFHADGFTLRQDAATVSISNTGDKAGETVVQVYARNMTSSFAPPRPVLVGFARTGMLWPGETTLVEVKLDKNAFTVVNDEGERVQDGAQWEVFAGLCQPDEKSVQLCGDEPLRMEIEV